MNLSISVVRADFSLLNQIHLESTIPEVKHVSFLIYQTPMVELRAIPSDYIQEIVRFTDQLSAIPQQPANVFGLFVHRGSPTLVLDPGLNDCGSQETYALEDINYLLILASPYVGYAIPARQVLGFAEQKRVDKATSPQPVINHNNTLVPIADLSSLTA